MGIAASLLAGSFVAAAQTADSVTVGGVTFDFAEPAPPLTADQQSFYRQFREAINSRNASALLALQNPAVNNCKHAANEILLRDMRYTIPENAKVRLFPSTVDIAKEAGMGDVAYLPIAPTAMLGVSYRVATKDHVSLTQIMQPVRQDGDRITLVPYCLTEKGQELMNKKKAETN
jgi:hypothetical protein